MQNHSASFQAAWQLQGKNSLALQWRPSDTQPLPLQGPQLSRAHQLQSSRHSQDFICCHGPSKCQHEKMKRKAEISTGAVWGQRGCIWWPFFFWRGGGWEAQVVMKSNKSRTSASTEKRTSPVVCAPFSSSQVWEPGLPPPGLQGPEKASATQRLWVCQFPK